MELLDAGVPLPILLPIKQTILRVEGVKVSLNVRDSLICFNRIVGLK